jgi:uncharacterized membrane protein
VRYLAYPFALAAAFVAVVNFIQVVISRQVFHPEASRRSPRRIRHDSFAAGVATAGISMAFFGVATAATWLVGPGFVVAVIGYSILFSGRSRSRSRRRGR